MASLSDAKTLGGVGAILVLIPFVSIIGWILVLVAVKRVGEVTGDRSIFRNAIYAVLTLIVATIIATLVFLLPLLGAGIIPTEGADPTSPTAFFSGNLLIALALTWILSIVATVFLRKSYNTIASRLQVKRFRTTGTLFLVGAILIIAIVGGIILFVGIIFQILAFFSIPEEVPGAAPAAPPTPPPMPEQAAAPEAAPTEAPPPEE